MAKLFEPITIKDITFKNRIGVSPMCQYSSNDGVANHWHLVHLGSRAVGGAGLIIAEATAISPQGRITPNCAGLWNDAQIDALRPITDFIKQHGAVAGIQIAHAGRKASAASPWDGGQHLRHEDGGWDIISPSSQAFDDDGKRLWKAPNMMSVDDIKNIQQQFVDCAKRAIDAGYQLLEIHAAHGYLLHSFFTPLVNHRNDEYGGSLKNRARMLLEVVEKVKTVWPEKYPLAVRLSLCDWDDGNDGLTIDDNIQLAQWLKQAGVDIIDGSSGGANKNARSSMSHRTHKQVGLAGQIKQSVDINVMAVGEINDPNHANNIIADGIADFTLLGRESLRNPYWAYHAAKILGHDGQIMPIQNHFFVG